jgi:hypothetical protein
MSEEIPTDPIALLNWVLDRHPQGNQLTEAFIPVIKRYAVTKDMEMFHRDTKAAIERVLKETP